jgi:hypothetical protein
MHRRLLEIFLSKTKATASAASISPQQQADKAGRSNEPDIELVATGSDIEGQASQPVNEDSFGNEEGAEVQYKTCDWW